MSEVVVGITMALQRSWDRYGRRATRPAHHGTARPRRPDNRFNQWLDQKLRRLYENELAEPIPDEMLNLLRAIEAGE